MRDELKLALKLPVLETLEHHKSGRTSHASEIDAGEVDEVDNASAVMATKDVLVAEPPAPIRHLPIMGTVQVHPITIRKTPKFPSRDRHLAIRRRKKVEQGSDGLEKNILDDENAVQCVCKNSEEGNVEDEVDSKPGDDDKDKEVE